MGMRTRCPRRACSGRWAGRVLGRSEGLSAAWGPGRPEEAPALALAGKGPTCLLGDALRCSPQRGGHPVHRGGQPAAMGGACAGGPGPGSPAPARGRGAGAGARAGRRGAERWRASLAGSARSRMPACDTPYLSGSETRCSGHPDGFVTLPAGLCAHKPIKGLHRYNGESILCLLSNAGIIQLVTG